MSFLRKARQCGRGLLIRDIGTLNHLFQYRKAQCGRGRFGNFDRVIHDVKTGNYAKPQTGRGIFNNMVGDYAWGQRMKYRI